MKITFALSEFQKDPRKAVAPVKGATAFFVSIKGKRLLVKIWRSTNFQQCKPEHGTSYYVLLNTHYFRLTLAKHPLALVIGVEGQIRPLATIREVAA